MNYRTYDTSLWCHINFYDVIPIFWHFLFHNPEFSSDLREICHSFICRKPTRVEIRCGPYRLQSSSVHTDLGREEFIAHQKAHACGERERGEEHTQHSVQPSSLWQALFSSALYTIFLWPLCDHMLTWFTLFPSSAFTGRLNSGVFSSASIINFTGRLKLKAILFRSHQFLFRRPEPGAILSLVALKLFLIDWQEGLFLPLSC